MKSRVGIVCEGSHDFIVIQNILANILSGRGASEVVVDALQPRIDETSRQVDGGGWAAVSEWCNANSGPAWGMFIDKPLFAASPTYDFIIVHVDGDVLEVSGKFSPVDRRRVGESVVRRIVRVSSWIQDLLFLPDEYRRTLVISVPTRHMEAWLLAVLEPAAKNIELRPCKGRVKRLLRRRFHGTATHQVERAAEILLKSLAVVRSRCTSFRDFDRQLQAVPLRYESQRQ